MRNDDGEKQTHHDTYLLARLDTCRNAALNIPEHFRLRSGVSSQAGGWERGVSQAIDDLTSCDIGLAVKWNANCGIARRGLTMEDAVLDPNKEANEWLRHRSL